MIGLSLTPASAQGQCATKWNPLFQQYQTRYSDGSTATETYNPLLKQWERNIQPAPNQGQGFQPQQRCVKKWHRLFQQWETNCY